MDWAKYESDSYKYPQRAQGYAILFDGNFVVISIEKNDNECM